MSELPDAKNTDVIANKEIVTPFSSNDDGSHSPSAEKARLSDQKPHLECAICLNPCNLPVEIPCGHVFCFLCIKGVCLRNSRCPLCRLAVPTNYFHEPKLAVDKTLLAESCGLPGCSKNLDDTTEVQEKENTDSAEAWFYEGRNGWWRYDDCAQACLETAYETDPNSHAELAISGFFYIVDFRSMIQYRKDAPARRRRVRRAQKISARNDDGAQLDNGIIKGIAGLKI